MSVLKIEDVAHVRFSASGLGRMRAYLGDFGLAVSNKPTRASSRVARGPPPSPM